MTDFSEIACSANNPVKVDSQGIRNDCPFSTISKDFSPKKKLTRRVSSQIIPTLELPKSGSKGCSSRNEELSAVTAPLLLFN
jgi:hypothetical protein